MYVVLFVDTDRRCLRKPNLNEIKNMLGKNLLYSGNYANFGGGVIRNSFHMLYCYITNIKFLKRRLFYLEHIK